jgi:uncharacterized membrane protein YadS
MRVFEGVAIYILATMIAATHAIGPQHVYIASLTTKIARDLLLFSDLP